MNQKHSACLKRQSPFSRHDLPAWSSLSLGDYAVSQSPFMSTTTRLCQIRRWQEQRRKPVGSSVMRV